MNKILSCLALLISSLVVYSQDGTVDENFGQNGTRYYNHFGANSGIESIIRSGDFLYGAGYTKQATREEFSIFKMDLNGDPVSNFGDNGLKIYSIGNGFARADVIMEQEDGKLVAAGWARMSNKDLYTLVRFYPDGTPDSTFSGDGIVTGSYSTSTYAEDEIYDARILSDGRIVVAGRSYNGQNDDAFLGCIDHEGNPCSGFGTNGVHVIEFSEGIGTETARALAIDPADNIFVGGRVLLSHSAEASFFILKYNSQGVQDNDFGTSGKVIHTVAENIGAGLNALEIDHAGRILTGGGAFNTDDLDNDYFMTRYSAEGVLDDDFGDHGVFTISRIDNESIHDLHVLPGNDVLAAGSTGGFPSQFAVMRIKSNGTPDPNFGEEGWALAYAAAGFNSINSIALDENGSIFGAGHTYISSIFHMAMVKFENTLTALPPSLAQKIGLDISPNPANEASVLHFDLVEKAIFSLDLMDVNGRFIRSFANNISLIPGSHEFNIDLSGITTGNYLAVIQIDHERGSILIVKK